MDFTTEYLGVSSATLVFCKIFAVIGCLGTAFLIFMYIKSSKKTVSFLIIVTISGLFNYLAINNSFKDYPAGPGPLHFQTIFLTAQIIASINSKRNMFYYICFLLLSIIAGGYLIALTVIHYDLYLFYEILAASSAALLIILGLTIESSHKIFPLLIGIFGATLAGLFIMVRILKSDFFNQVTLCYDLACTGLFPASVALLLMGIDKTGGEEATNLL